MSTLTATLDYDDDPQAYQTGQFIHFWGTPSGDMAVHLERGDWEDLGSPRTIAVQITAVA